MYFLKQLFRFTTYVYKVFVHNSVGFTPSQEATVKTLAGRPERGANVTVTVLNHTAIDVRWVKPSKSALCFFISPSCVCIKMNFKRTDF